MRAWESFLKVTDWSSGFESVSRYLGHFKRKTRSEGTKELSCDVLMRFCKFAAKNPDELVRLSPGEASKLVQSYVDSLADKGQSIRTVNVGLTFLRTFFHVNGFKAGREIEVERFFQPSRYRKIPEYIPTAEEIFRMAYAAGSARNKAMVLGLYTSGLRNSTLRALRYMDVAAELERYEVVKVPVYPEMKQVDPRACKGNIPYYTFFSKETVVALKEYLNERRNLFGDIEADEPLFASTSSNVPSEVRRRKLAKRNTLALVVKRAAKRGDIERWREVHPHCLRKAFDSALRNGGLDVKDQEFLMGHILPGIQDPYYDSSKTEELRTKYSAVKFFKTEATDKLEMIKAFAQTLGIDKIEVKIQKLREQHTGLNEIEALGRIMRQKLGINPLKTKMAKLRKNDEKEDCTDGNCGKHGTKIVTENELLAYLDEGWDLVKELKSGKIVIKRELQPEDTA